MAGKEILDKTTASSSASASEWYTLLHEGNLLSGLSTSNRLLTENGLALPDTVGIELCRGTLGIGRGVGDFDDIGILFTPWALSTGTWLHLKALGFVALRRCKYAALEIQCQTDDEGATGNEGAAGGTGEGLSVLLWVLSHFCLERHSSSKRHGEFLMDNVVLAHLMLHIRLQLCRTL
jgi:hypothetical protein